MLCFGHPLVPHQMVLWWHQRDPWTVNFWSVRSCSERVYASLGAIFKKNVQVDPEILVYRAISDDQWVSEWPPGVPGLLGVGIGHQPGACSVRVSSRYLIHQQVCRSCCMVQVLTQHWVVRPGGREDTRLDILGLLSLTPKELCPRSSTSSLYFTLSLAMLHIRLNMFKSWSPHSFSWVVRFGLIKFPNVCV